MKAIVFIPGYKGSELVSSINNGKKIWISFSSAFKNNEPLKLFIDKENTPLPTSGVIKDIPPIIKLYGPIINSLRALSPEYTTRVFSYDWRFSIYDTAKQLHLFLLNLQDEGYNEINFVTHSMGGCILSYYLRYGINDKLPQWSQIPNVKSVVFCASPFAGTVRALKYVLTGNSFGLNKKFLGNRTCSTFPVAYQMIPFYNNSLCLLSNHSCFDIFAVDNWSNLKLGLFNSNEYSYPSIYSFMSKSLYNAHSILALINDNSGPKAPKSLRILNLISDSVETSNKLYLNTSNNNNLIYDMKELQSIDSQSISPGDGLVCLSSGRYPSSNLITNFKEKVLPFGHKNLFTKKYVINTINEFIRS